jgi:putative hydrolase of the HAD superfamily
MSSANLIVFDLDDTLVDTSHVYWTAREAFLDIMVAQGIDRSVAEESFEAIDESHIEQYGYVPERYTKSMLKTYEALVGLPSNAEGFGIERRIVGAGTLILNCMPELIDGARELLDWAGQRYSLGLLTRGVENLQRRKLQANNIGRFFEHVEIVAEKNASVLARFIRHAGYSPSSAWVIGDSIRSDINPGLEVGASCVMYWYRHHSYAWRQEYGSSPKGKFHVAQSLRECPAILNNPRKDNMVSSLHEYVARFSRQAS